MKFRVGDRVKYVKKIIHHNVVTGGIFKITYIDGNNQSFQYLAESKKGNKQWFKEEELQKVEYTYEDLQKSPIGTKITFKNGIVLVKDTKEYFENAYNTRHITNLEYLEDIDFDKIIKIEEPEYQTVYESKPEILDDVEKRYLRGVIRPFKDKVKYIKKYFSRTVGKEYLQIKLEEDRPMNLPYFEVSTMYKGMKRNKEYSLEELGL